MRFFFLSVYILTGKRNITKCRCKCFQSKNEKFKFSYINSMLNVYRCNLFTKFRFPEKTIVWTIYKSSRVGLQRNIHVWAKGDFLHFNHLWKKAHNEFSAFHIVEVRCIHFVNVLMFTWRHFRKNLVLVPKKFRIDMQNPF